MDNPISVHVVRKEYGLVRKERQGEQFNQK